MICKYIDFLTNVVFVDVGNMVITREMLFITNFFTYLIPCLLFEVFEIQEWKYRFRYFESLNFGM